MMQFIKGKPWLIWFVIFVCCFALVGCGNGQDSQAQGNVSMRVEIPDGDGYETEFMAAEGTTALDMLIDMGKICGFPVVYNQGVGVGSGYVEGIGDVFQFDQGPESGWIYFVNGEMPPVSAGEYEPVAEDVIVWQYITSYDQLLPQNSEDSGKKIQ